MLLRSLLDDPWSSTFNDSESDLRERGLEGSAYSDESDSSGLTGRKPLAT
jgi:hypothetical protein